MAPFSGFRGRSRSGNRGSNGGIRGRPARGRGRGRGTGDSITKPGHKSTFFSTRVEEDPKTTFEGSEEGSDFREEDSAVEDTQLSSDSDEDDPLSTVQPYSALLQTLNTKSEREEPARKKRKFEQTRNSENEDDIVIEGDLDGLEEPENADDLSTDADFEIEELDEDHDPFSRHIANLGAENLEEKISAIKQNTWLTNKPSGNSQWSHILKVPAVPGSHPQHDSNVGRVSGIEDLTLKQKLKELAREELASFDELMAHLAYPIFQYQDLLFSHRSLENSANLRKLVCLHALNHVFKTRDRVIKGNARLTKEDATEDFELRDQGFTRPKVLVILPTRQSCVRYIQTITSLCKPEQQENRKRFQDSYAAGQSVSDDKPEDFRELFDGNDDDMFRLGLKFTRKTIKFFSQFYNSDIIFASPLGLRMALGGEDAKKQDHDFLSSIEIVLMDQTEAVLMQNWDHIEYIFERLNLQPREAHGCDFSRVRNWYLEGNAKFLRQTILFSAFNSPSLNKIYTHYMLNVAGKIKYVKEEDGAMIDLGLSLKQTFSRFDYGTTVDEPDNRFKYFTTALVPSLTKTARHSASGGQGVLIYLPLYADFLRVRNYLAGSSATQDISFGSISEYTSVQDVARARSHFVSGRHSVLLYTERAHHFRRYHLKGVKKVIMYGLPENPIFYKEIVGGFLDASISAAKLSAREASARALFSKLDILKLERIVGTERYKSMLKEKTGDTFDFF